MEPRIIQHQSPEYLLAVDLRRRVLRLPLGLDFTPEILEAEAGDTHFGVVEGGRCVACGTHTLASAGVGKIRQMAVEPDAQGQGLGARVVLAIEAHARSLGVEEIVLHAREVARGFYLKLGYVPEGEPFVEVTLPHIRMRKKLALGQLDEL